MKQIHSKLICFLICALITFPICSYAGANCDTAAILSKHSESNEPSINNLQAELKKIEKSVLYFREKRLMEGLEVPIEFTGIVKYMAPNQLEKQILTPQKESYAVIDNQLLIKRNNKQERRVNMSRYPILVALIESIRSTLNGQFNNLSQYYEVRYHIQHDKWVLCLLPAKSKLQQYISRIEIFGLTNTIDRINLFENNGDISVMLMSHQPLN